MSDDAKAHEAFQKARDQLTAIVRRDPDHNARAHRELGRALVVLRVNGDLTEAIAQYEAALKGNQNFVEVHKALGRAKFYVGDFDGAVPELTSAAKCRDPYEILWLYLARAHGSEDPRSRENARSELEQRINDSGFPSNIWPYALIELFLNKDESAESEKIEKALSESQENADYRCEANFYIGERQLLKGKDHEGDALEQIRKAYKDCRADFIEFLGAESELRRRHLILNDDRDPGAPTPRLPTEVIE
jgi:lipoprotein NlpI